jgi:hypothetical protein
LQPEVSLLRRGWENFHYKKFIILVLIYKHNEGGEGGGLGDRHYRSGGGNGNGGAMAVGGQGAGSSAQ